MINNVLWGCVYVFTFLAAFASSAYFKMNPPASSSSVEWSDAVGIVYNDLAYGEGEANKFDLYVPADNSKESYGLVVYLHSGGFASGDKSDDTEMLQWLCSKGYVAAGINYTLFNAENPSANVYTQSVEIKESIPYIIEEAAKCGYNIDRMAMSGGSAGGCLALLYAYRDADTSPVPVKIVFEAVGPSSFYPEDWTCFGFDKSPEAAAAMFSLMSGNEITVDMIGTPAYDEAIKNISALLWVNEDTVPTVLAYGAYDKMQSFEASKQLDAALTAYNVPHEYIVCEHSGHGLQNDSDKAELYLQKIEEYLAKYIPA